jgi:hypothetical protein
MNRFYALFAFLLLAFGISAQKARIPNETFSYDWKHVRDTTINGYTYPGYSEPGPQSFWCTPNPASRAMQNFPPMVHMSWEANFGWHSVLLKAVKMPFGIAAGSLISGIYKGGLDPAKAVFIGRDWTTDRPEKMIGYYKYIPKDNDRCRAYILLYANTTGTRDTIGFAAFNSTQMAKTVTEFTLFELPINYRSTNAVDSIAIVFTTSADGANLKGGEGSIFQLDRVQVLYTGETAVDVIEDEKAKVHLYPNPAYDDITVTLHENLTGTSTLEIYNMYGQVVKTEPLSNTHNWVQLDELSSGNYSYTVVNNGEKVAFGKFIKQ